MEKQESIVKIIPGERFTPVTLAKKLGALALLESSSFVKGKERYSLLLVRKGFHLEQRDGRIYYVDETKRARMSAHYKDILDACEYFAEQHHPPAQDFPFPSGGVGFLSYEFAKYCDKIRFRDRPDPLGLPEASFIFGHVFLIFDHYTDLLYLIGLNYAEHRIDLERALLEIEETIRDFNFNYLQEPKQEQPARIEEDPFDRERFLQGVETLQQEIIMGNLLQAVLSRRIIVSTPLPAFEAYRNLRRVNPSPYQFYLDFGDYQLFGASPEMHVKVKDGKAIIHPIAGTRRRGKSEKEDRALEAELREDPKEKAEHLMLVDLARNDLGRICEPGSVRVTTFMGVERYSHVMHLVSEVEGVLKQENNTIPMKTVRASDVIRATFPAGTVSGAPKIRAVETLDRIEPVPRSFYAGLVGYFEAGGGFDSCITIRSALKKGNRIVLQAGAGVVYDSTPEREYEETQEKLGALKAALGLVEDIDLGKSIALGADKLKIRT
ncbi:MAG: chorismate-binding protein [Spirochaetes bacterium]|nr:chorismate-binding protein [Spirochaetota bacterium]